MDIVLSLNIKHCTQKTILSVDGLSACNIYFMIFYDNCGENNWFTNTIKH